MEIDQSTIDNAVRYLMDGKETDAAHVLEDCTLENWEIVDHWMDGARQLDGLLLEVGCSRYSYDILINRDHPFTISIERALHAVLPGGTYLNSLRARVVPSKSIV